MRITRGSWAKYISVLRKLSSKAADDMIKYEKQIYNQVVNEKKLSVEEGNRLLVDYAYGLATKYGEGTAAAACEMYDTTAYLSGVKLKPAVPAKTATYGEVIRTVKGVQLVSQAPEAVGAAVGRLVKTAGVDTTIQNAIRDGAEWAWIPSGDSCPFCMMLASQGWVRASEKVLRGNHASHIHNNCDCTFAIRHDGVSTVEGYDPDALRAQWDAAEGSTPDEKLNFLRRRNYAANKDAINAQKRAAYAKRAGTSGQGNGKRPRLRLTTVAASTIIGKLKSGEYSLKLSRQQYDKHVAGTKEYVAYEAGRKKKGLNAQSRLTISYEEAQKIIEEKSGTGIIKVRKDGTPTNVEWITCDKVIGQYCHHGQFYETKKAMIIHGKKGSHIVPHKGNKYD